MIYLVRSNEQSSNRILFLVTDQTTNNKKAAIRKLNSTQMSFLVGQPSITLDKLHKIPNFIKKETITTQTKDINEKARLEKDLIYVVSTLSFMMMHYVRIKLELHYEKYF